MLFKFPEQNQEVTLIKLIYCDSEIDSEIVKVYYTFTSFSL